MKSFIKNLTDISTCNPNNAFEVVDTDEPAGFVDSDEEEGEIIEEEAIRYSQCIPKILASTQKQEKKQLKNTRGGGLSILKKGSRYVPKTFFKVEAKLNKLPIQVLYRIVLFLQLDDITRLFCVSKQLSKLNLFNICEPKRFCEEEYAKMLDRKKGVGRKILKKVLTFKHFDCNFSVEEGENFFTYICYKNFSLCSHYVMQRLKKTVDIVAFDERAFLTACRRGNTDIVRQFLKDGRVKRIWEAFLESISHNNIQNVKLLLKDKRVDMTTHDCVCIFECVDTGHFDVFKLLVGRLEQKKLHKKLDFHKLLLRAIDKSKADFVVWLLNNKNVDPAAERNLAIRHACSLGKVECVKVLLKDERVDPGDGNQEALCWSAEQGKLEIVRLLLRDKRVDVLANNKYAHRMAVQSGYKGIARLLEKEIGKKEAVLKKEEERQLNEMRKKLQAENERIESDRRKMIKRLKQNPLETCLDGIFDDDDEEEEEGEKQKGKSSQ